MAQALGGRYGLAHGTMNAVCLPPALASTPRSRRTRSRASAAMGDDAVARTEELAALAGAKRLRDYAVPRGDLPELAEATAARPAAKGNPRPAPAEEILKLLESVW